MKRHQRLAAGLLLLAGLLTAHGQQTAVGGGVSMRIVPLHQGKEHRVPAVAWLQPVGETPKLPFVPQGNYTLLQKNRTFIPHLQVIPKGSVVQFPNADPFFHNVFSLYNGRRFDLGLYEAGSSKSVTFSREGVSYIFCNIHPEMSAVIVSLSTPLYAIADAHDAILLRNVPPGDYRMELWVEGAPQSILTGMSRDLHVSGGVLDLGEIRVANSTAPEHKNKFGEAYQQDSPSPY